MNCLNFSTLGINFTLEEINSVRAEHLIPTTAYISVLMVTGIIGNVLVLFIYGFTLKASNYRTFTLSLAAIDLTACCVYMPAEIVDQTLPYMFFSEAACTGCRFIGRVTLIGNALVMLVIAIERYRRVCLSPRKQISNKLGLCMCFVAIVIALGLSWPTLLIEGLKEERFGGNITGYDCGTRSVIRETPFYLIYTIVLLTLYSILFLILIALYGFIIKTVVRASTVTENRKSEIGNAAIQVTKIMLWISIGFILSYVPHFGFEINSAIKHGDVGCDTPFSLALYPLLSRSFFLNNAINPIILAIGDRKFRDRCWKLMTCSCSKILLRSHGSSIQNK